MADTVLTLGDVGEAIPGLTLPETGLTKTKKNPNNLRSQRAQISGLHSSVVWSEETTASKPESKRFTIINFQTRRELVVPSKRRSSICR